MYVSASKEFCAALASVQENWSVATRKWEIKPWVKTRFGRVGEKQGTDPVRVYVKLILLW